MLPIGSLIGGALGVGSSIYGGIKASQAMKGIKKNLEDQQRENQAWYDRRYNEDPTQRADAQRILQLTADNIRRRNQAAAGRAAVMGGSGAAEAAARAENNEALAAVASSIAAAGEARKDRIEEQYQQRKSGLDSQLNNMDAARAQAITQAMGGAASAAGELGGSIDEWLDKK